MKKLMALMTVLVAFAAPNAAQAFCCEDFAQGMYLGVFGAADFPADKHHSHNHSSSGSGNAHNRHEKGLKDGYFIAGSLGRRNCGFFRGELEGGYHHNSRKKHHHHSSSHHNNNNRRHGDANTWSIMLNGYYDIETCWCVKPFVGVGLGFASTELKRHHKHNNNSSSGFDCAGGCGDNSSSSHHHKKHHDKDGFAWQLIAGIAYPVCDCWEVSLQYRYFNPTAVSRLHYNDVGIGLAYAF